MSSVKKQDDSLTLQEQARAMKQAKSEIDNILKEIKKVIKCSICQTSLKHPISLPCSHCYCQECLKSYMTTKSKFKCPNCQRVTQFSTFHNILRNNNIFNQSKIVVVKPNKRMKQLKI